MDNKVVWICLMALILFLNSCKKEVKFSKEAWGVQSADPILPPPFREGMLTDLTTHYLLKGLKFN
jgi:hypothetical protein